MTRRDELIEQATAFAEDCDLYNDPIEAMADFSAVIYLPQYAKGSNV